VRVLSSSLRYKHLYARHVHALKKEKRKKKKKAREMSLSMSMASPGKVDGLSRAEAVELQALEDKMPAFTLAWCRRLVLDQQAASKRGKPSLFRQTSSDKRLLRSDTPPSQAIKGGAGLSVKVCSHHLRSRKTPCNRRVTAV